MNETARIFHYKGPKVVIDGGNKVTLSGGKEVRILYQNKLHDGEIEIRVLEAKTAKLVETKRFKATSPTCPSTYKFWGARDQVLTKLEPAGTKYFAAFEGR